MTLHCSCPIGFADASSGLISGSESHRGFYLQQCPRHTSWHHCVVADIPLIFESAYESLQLTGHSDIFLLCPETPLLPHERRGASPQRPGNWDGHPGSLLICWGVSQEAQFLTTAASSGSGLTCRFPLLGSYSAISKASVQLLCFLNGENTVG